MNASVFYSHSLTERMALVNRSGEFISRIRYYGFYINLYLLDSQYVEVYYNTLCNAIEEVDILSPIDERLNLYAVQVNLSDLFKKAG